MTPAVRFVSPRVRAADVDGLIMVADLQTAAFYLLDEKASCMWHKLLKAQGSVVAAKEALRQGNPSVPCTVDMFDDFVANCESRGFLVGQPPPAPRCRQPRGQGQPPRKPLLGVRAWLAMLLTDLALRRHGFAGVYERLENTTGPQCERVDSDYVEAARTAFVAAENLYLRRRAPNDCLPRSLALCIYMRRLGIPVTHCVGARRFPVFRAHSWVEYHGVPILERRAEVTDLTTIASV